MRRESVGWWRMLLRMFIHLWICSHVFLKLCSATDIPCTVIQDGERTRYIVPEFKETPCDYKWLNMTNHTLANGEQQTVAPMVVLNTNRSLVTNKCLKLIYYSRTCFPEGIKQTATCTSNCSRNSVVPIEGDIPPWIPPVISVVLLLLLLLGLLGFLCYRFRHRISSWLPVKTEEDSSMSSVRSNI